MFPPNTSRPLSLGGAGILPAVTGGTPLTHTVTPRVPLQAAAGHDMPTQAPAIWGAGSPLHTAGLTALGMLPQSISIKLRAPRLSKVTSVVFHPWFKGIRL